MAYASPDGKVGVLVELTCETDFVARTNEFHELAHAIAVQVAATSPEVVGDMDGDTSDDRALLNQPYVHDGGLTIRALIKRAVNLTSEGIEVRSFVRLELGDGQVAEDSIM